MIGSNYPTLESLFQRPSGLGKVFFVDNGGSDSQEGTDPNYPLLTITTALGKCTASKGDTIIMLQNSPSSPPGDETFPIVINKAGVLLAGLYSRGLLSDSGFGTDQVDGNTITISANYVSIENLYLGLKTGGTTGNVIEGGMSAFAFTLRNCVIETQYQALYGFFTGGAYDFPYLLIEDCIFGSAQANRFTSAIRLFNATFGMIRRNVFMHCSSYAINLQANCGNVSILDNRFKLSADTDGFAVFAANGAFENFIDGNHAAHGINTPANDPFWEGGADGDNDWGLNHKGTTAIGAART